MDWSAHLEIGHVIKPPFIPRFLLGSCIHPSDRDEVLGDLDEVFAELIPENGKHRANTWYWYQMLRSAPWFLIQSFAWNVVMLKNYLKLTLRTLAKQKLQGAINIAGLSLGIALCVLIAFFVRDETSYEKFHEGYENIKEVQTWYFNPDGSTKHKIPFVGAPVAEAALLEIPGITEAARARIGRSYFRIGSSVFQERMLYVDPTFLSIFNFPLISGDAQSAFTQRNHIILSESASLQLFGSLETIGSAVEVRLGGEYREYEVSAIAKNPPGNTKFQFDAMVLIDPWIETSYPAAIGSFGYNIVQTYVVTRPDALLDNINKNLSSLYALHNETPFDYNLEREDFLGQNLPMTYQAIPLQSVYLSRQSKAVYSLILGAIALGILLLACINFMTMSIGRSLFRSREVGVRKVVGATRSQLIGQFWGEAFLLTIISAIIGVVIAWQALPYFNGLTEKNLAFELISQWPLVASIILIVILTGLIAGSYPSFVLSSFRPVDVLKSRVRISGSNFYTRSLVALQFTLSVSLIIMTLIMQRQMNTIQERDLGFDSDQVVLVTLNGLDGTGTANQFKQLLEGESSVDGITLAGSALGSRFINGLSWADEGQQLHIDVLSVDHAFMGEMKIEIVEGRDFDVTRDTNASRVVLVNQALVDEFSIEDPVGKQLPVFPGDDSPTIIGVTPNFNYSSLHELVGPLMITVDTDWKHEFIYVKLAPGDHRASIDLLSAAWKNVSQDIPFQFQFLDDRIEQAYSADLRWGRIVNLGSGFAIFLALLGLIGLTSLSVQSRRKEIGIRKTMGASDGRIIGLLIRDFASLIVIGSLLAVPLSYLLADQWLSNFAFQMDVEWTIYFVAASVVLIASVLTITAQSFRTVRANPIEALRSE